MRKPTFKQRRLFRAAGVNVPMEWHDRTNRAVCTWQEPHWKEVLSAMSYEDRKSTWNSRVRNAIR